MGSARNPAPKRLPWTRAFRPCRRLPSRLRRSRWWSLRRSRPSSKCHSCFHPKKAPPPRYRLPPPVLTRQAKVQRTSAESRAASARHRFRKSPPPRSTATGGTSRRTRRAGRRRRRRPSSAQKWMMASRRRSRWPQRPRPKVWCTLSDEDGVRRRTTRAFSSEALAVVIIVIAQKRRLRTSNVAVIDLRLTCPVLRGGFVVCQLGVPGETLKFENRLTNLNGICYI